MAKYTDENGNVVENLLTPDEVQKRLDDEISKKVEEEKKNWETSSEAKVTEIENKLSALEVEKKQLEEQIASNAGDDKDHPNFKVLKEALDKKDEAIKNLANDINSLKTQGETDFLNTEIKKIAGNDEEVKKTIKHHYDETLKSMPNVSKEDITTRLEAAIRLSGRNDSVNPIDFAGNGSGFSNFNNNNDSDKELNSKEKDLGKKLGLSEDDYKKYSPKLKDKYGK